MPIDFGSLAIRGSMKFQCENIAFSLQFEGERIVAVFSSFPDLFRTRKEASKLIAEIKKLPNLPKLRGRTNHITGSLPKTDPLGGRTIWVTVKGRPVGKLISDLGKLKFHPTPLRFFTKNV